MAKPFVLNIQPGILTPKESDDLQDLLKKYLQGLGSNLADVKADGTWTPCISSSEATAL